MRANAFNFVPSATLQTGTKMQLAYKDVFSCTCPLSLILRYYWYGRSSTLIFVQNACLKTEDNRSIYIYIYLLITINGLYCEHWITHCKSSKQRKESVSGVVQYLNCWVFWSKISKIQTLLNLVMPQFCTLFIRFLCVSKVSALS